MQLRKAKEYALTLLGYRPYSEKALCQRLEGKGFTGRVIKEVITDMKEYGYLNDEAYARQWIEILLRRRGFGSYRLFQELVARGIEHDLAEKLVGELPPEGELERAREAAWKKFKTLKSQTGSQAYRKVAQYLMRRGFSGEISRRVLEELFSGYQQQGPT